MNRSRNLMVVVLVVVMVAIGLQTVVNSQPVRGQHEGSAAGAGPRYTVVATEGHNLIVTDNHNNELFFYTIDQNAEIGSELKLRGRIDLTQVGKPEIKPTTHKRES